jgi:hypothetical protein
MPASMIILEFTSRWKVAGRRRDMAAGGPKPGKTPTSVPIRTPIKQNKRFEGSRAILNPIKMLSIKLILNLKIQVFL